MIWNEKELGTLGIFPIVRKRLHRAVSKCQIAASDDAQSGNMSCLGKIEVSEPNIVRHCHQG
jgi:hypothetical protein